MYGGKEDGRQEVLDNLDKAVAAAGDALITLRKIIDGNYKEGQAPMQFDYCASAELAQKVASLETVTKRIDNIVFQKKRR